MKLKSTVTNNTRAPIGALVLLYYFFFDLITVYYKIHLLSKEFIISYRDDKWYDFMNSLNYRDGVFIDKREIVTTLKAEIEKAYQAGLSDFVPEKVSWGSIILTSLMVNIIVAGASILGTLAYIIYS